MRARGPRRCFEATILAAIHAWAVARAPRILRLLPARAPESDPVVLEGAGLAGEGLRVHFGPVSTWALPLSDRRAVAIVPSGAAAGPVNVARQGLRSNSVCFGGPSDEGPARVERMDPRDGATGVLRDTPVIARLSRPADPLTLSAQSFQVRDDLGPVPGHIRLSPDGRVLIWQAERPLRSDALHFVTTAGLRDRRGGAVSPLVSRFLTCDLVRADLPG